MRKEMEMELKVGLFVSIGIGLVALAILMLGGANTLFVRQDHFTMHFQAADGLISGAKVLLGGLPVGTVTDVDFDHKTKNIKVGIIVEKKYEDLIRTDSRAEIATQGLLGDKYVAITVGNETEPKIEPGGEIPIRQGKDIAAILGKSDKLIANLDSITMNLDQILRSFNNAGRSEVFFQGMAESAKNLASLTGKLNDQMERNQLHLITKNLNGILEKINNGTGTLGALVNDPGLYEDLKALMGGANRNRIVRNLVRKTIKDAEEAKLEQQSQK